MRNRILETALLIATMPLDKGQLNGTCNRTACSNRPATWWSSVERAHYCQPCALKINEYIPEGVAKLVRASQGERDEH
jgi:hypothetical protein